MRQNRQCPTERCQLGCYWSVSQPFLVYRGQVCSKNHSSPLSENWEDPKVPKAGIPKKLKAGSFQNWKKKGIQYLSIYTMPRHVRLKNGNPLASGKPQSHFRVTGRHLIKKENWLIVTRLAPQVAQFTDTTLEYRSKMCARGFVKSKSPGSA